MKTNMDHLAQDLARLNLQIRHDMEQAEAKVAQVNRLVKKLGKTGLLNDLTTWDGFRAARFTPLEGSSEMPDCRITLAALLVPDGFGICAWESEKAYLGDVSKTGLKARAQRRFVPFAKCDLRDKAFLLPVIEEVLDELIDVACIAAARKEKGPYIEVNDFFAQRRAAQEKKGNKG